MSDDLELSEQAALTRAMWNEDAPNWVERGRASWESPAPWWGMFEVPERELNALPDVAGVEAIDLGCGTGYWCAWLARLGARVVGLDVSEAQLDTARQLQAEHRLEFPLVHASAEAVPFGDESFDLVFSEYGAAIWCDPYVWIPEARRLLPPGGWLVFLCHSPLSVLCTPQSDEPAGESLLRPQFGMHKLEWPGEAPDFCISHGEMLSLLHETGFRVEALHELRAPDGPADEARYFMRRGWARSWPAEDVWVARRRGDP